MFDVSGKLDRDGAMRTANAKIAIKRRAAIHDDRNGGERNHIVDDGGLAEQALQGRQRRLGAHRAAFAFKTVQKRGFLAADISARAHAYFHIEGAAGAEHGRAKNAFAPGDLDRLFHDLDSVRIFRTRIDEALRRADGKAGNRHAFDQHEGIAFHDHAVGEGAAIALVRIADDVFLVRDRIRNGLPFDTRRETRAATSAQAAFSHLGNNVQRCHGDGFFKAFHALIGAIILKRQRIGDATTRKCETRLAFQEWDILGWPETEPMLAAGEKPCIEERSNVARFDRPVGNTAMLGAHFHQHLKPEHAARTVADNMHIEIAAGGLAADRFGHAVCADGQRGGIAGNKNGDTHRRASVRMSPRQSSSRRAWTSPSSIRAGACAQSPRQKTGSSVTEPSAAVSCQSRPSRVLMVSARGSPPIDWQASARQSFKTCRPEG
ncbi:hypothetical protein D3C78_771310 [compost metagenome]